MSILDVHPMSGPISCTFQALICGFAIASIQRTVNHSCCATCIIFLMFACTGSTMVLLHIFFFFCFYCIFLFFSILKFCDHYTFLGTECPQCHLHKCVLCIGLNTIRRSGLLLHECVRNYRFFSQGIQKKNLRQLIPFFFYIYLNKCVYVKFCGLAHYCLSSVLPVTFLPQFLALYIEYVDTKSPAARGICTCSHRSSTVKGVYRPLHVS